MNSEDPGVAITPQMIRQAYQAACEGLSLPQIAGRIGLDANLLKQLLHTDTLPQPLSSCEPKPKPKRGKKTQANDNVSSDLSDDLKAAIEKGQQEAIGAVENALFEMARDKANITAIMYFLKCRGGDLWRDNKETPGPEPERPPKLIQGLDENKV
jgi:hypothetical protein